MERLSKKLSWKAYYRLIITLLLKYGILNKKTFKIMPLPKVEPDLFFLKEIINKGAICFDVGANVGMYTSILSSLVGPNGTIFSFEPSPLTFRLLKKIVFGRVKKLKNVNVFNMGLGSSKGHFGLIYQLDENGNIVDPLTRIDEKGGETPITTIDTIIEEERISKVDFIKIDVEGYEAKVVSWAINTIQRFHPIILMEVDNNWLGRYGTSNAEIFGLLSKYGYSAYTINFGKLCKLDDCGLGNIYFM